MQDSAGEPAGVGRPPAPSRELAVDALRGMALFGVLAVNLLYFAGPDIWTSDRLRLAFPGALDQAAVFAVLAVLAGKFISIFSLLFGFGAARQLAGGDAARFRRRLFALGVFGVAHGILLFAGDILLTYALIGLALPRAARWSTRTLVRTALLLWACSFLLSGLLGASLVLVGPSDPFETEVGVELYRSAGFLAITEHRLSDFATFLISNLIVGGPQVLGLMLLGIVAFREVQGRPLVETVGEARRKAAGLAPLAVAANLACAALATYGLYGGGMVAASVGSSLLWVVAPLLAFVLGAVALGAFTDPRGQALARRLAIGGRFSLSVYIGQSIVCGFIFYGYGLGLYGSVSPAGCLALAVLVYAGLLGLAQVWSRVVVLGPLEWLMARVIGPRSVPPLFP